MGGLAAIGAVPTLLWAHGEDVVHLPEGVSASAETITAIVDRTEQTPEFADSLRNANGERIPVSCVLSMRATIDVTTYQKRREDVSVFRFDGLPWWAVAVISTDRGDGMQLVVVTRNQGVTTIRTRG
jgi:hypothetical protein